MVREQPLRERRLALLALAQYQAGRQGDALANAAGAARRSRPRARLDLGVELVALEQAVLRQDPGLLEPRRCGGERRVPLPRAAAL